MYIRGNVYTSRNIVSLLSSFNKNESTGNNLTVTLLEGSRISTNSDGDKLNISKKAQEALISGSYETKTQLSNIYKKEYMENVQMQKGDALINYAERVSDEKTRIKMYETAASEYELAIKANSKSAQLQYKAGRAYLGAGQSSKAISFLEEAIKLSPAEAKYHTTLGTAYKKEGRYDKAIEEGKKVLKLDPYSDEGYSLLGDVYKEKGSFQEAQEEYKKALTINSTNPETYYKVGDLFERQKEYKKAYEFYKVAYSLDYTKPEYYEAMDRLKEKIE